MKKSKYLAIILFATYAFIILLLAINPDIMDNLILELTYLLSKLINNLNLCNTISFIILSFLIYFTLGLLNMFMLIELFNENRYIILYGIICPLLVITIVIVIHSFSIDLNFVRYLIRYVFILLGEIVIYIYYLIKNIRNCEKSVDKK